MLECLLVHGVWFWVISGLLILSEALGETKAVRANGVLSFCVGLLYILFRTMRNLLRRW